MDSQDSPTRRARMPWYGRKRWHFAVIDLLLVSLISSCLIVETQVDRVDATAPYPLKPTWGLGEDWLLVSHNGVSMPDSQRKEDHQTSGAGARRIDTIMLLHRRHDGGRPLLVSLPLRTYAVIAGYGPGSLEIAFIRGGPQLLTRTLEGITHTSIDHYVDIGFDGLAAMVNAVGGVRICPVRTPAAVRSAHCSNLSGSQALNYLYTRKSFRTDPGPAERQRRLLAALIEKVTSPGMALHPARIVAFTRTALRAVTIDRGTHLYDLIRLALVLRDGSLAARTIPTVKGGLVSPVGRFVLWDPEARAELIPSLVTDRAEPKSLIPD